MNDYIENRVIELAFYIIEEKATVRDAAKKFKIGKSTVHKDVAERLVYIDQALANDVREILNKNMAERHIRGGIATSIKYHKAI